jgi:hypothetical protein
MMRHDDRRYIPWLYRDEPGLDRETVLAYLVIVAVLLCGIGMAAVDMHYGIIR